eukprot:gene26292-27251_t
MGHLISLEDNLLGLPHLHKLLGVLALCFSLNFLAKGGLDVDAQPWLVRSTDWCKDRFGNDGKTRGVRRPLRSSDFQGGSNGDAGTKRAISIGRYFFSIAQLNATSQLIFVSDREYVLAGAYYTMVVIQITAFMMTLRKKGFMSPVGWKVVYTLLLGSTAITLVRTASSLSELCTISLVSVTFAGLRLKFSVDKFVLMAGVAAV